MTKTIKKLNLFGIVFLAIFALSTLPVVAKDDAEETPKEITSLNELLLKVQEEALYDSEENRARIAKFMAEKSTQDAVLQETLANLKIQEDRAVRLEKTFDENDVKLSELEDLKAERLGALVNFLVLLEVLQVKWVLRLKSQLSVENYKVVHKLLQI